MRRILIALFAALLSLSAVAQNRLVVQGVGELVGDDFAPRYAVFTEKYYNSMEWMELDGKIDRYISAHAFDEEPDEDDPLFDWNEYIKNMEEAIENYRREGNTEMAKTFQESLEEAKRYKEEMTETVNAIKEEAAENAAGLDRQELLDEVMKHAVGGRLFYYAESYLDGRYACVETKFFDEDENSYGLLDPQGKMVIPGRYQAIYLRGWPNRNGKTLALAYRVLSWDDDKWEVSVFWDDGTPATQQTFAGAKIIDQVELVSVRFPDGGWGLMNADARVITQRKYEKFDWNVNDVIDPSRGNFVYGERGGVNYIISPEDGSEIGTFKMTFNADGSTLHDVNYYPGKAPKGR